MKQLQIVLIIIFIINIYLIHCCIKYNSRIKFLEEQLLKKECEMSKINTNLDFYKGISHAYTPRNN